MSFWVRGTKDILILDQVFQHFDVAYSDDCRPLKGILRLMDYVAVVLMTFHTFIAHLQSWKRRIISLAIAQLDTVLFMYFFYFIGFVEDARLQRLQIVSQLSFIRVTFQPIAGSRSAYCFFNNPIIHVTRSHMHSHLILVSSLLF